MTTQELSLSNELKRLKKEAEIMKQIATPRGFYGYYFNSLANFKTNLDCFNHVNELYFQFFGEYKYSGYDSFKQNQKKHLKKQ